MEDNIKSMHREDLTKWKPSVNTDYNGYNYTNRHGHKRIGITIIYAKKGDNLEEHFGGFVIIGNQVKIWYIVGNEKVQKFIPISQCRFSKSIQGHTNYYHCTIDANLIKGNNMNNNDEKSDIVEYQPIKEKIGWLDRLLKRTDPMYWKKTIQVELDTRWATFDGSVEKLKTDFEKFNTQAMEITQDENNMEMAKTEWAESLTSLGNLLNKNTTHEKQMWETTQRNKNMKGLKIKQKFKDSDVDEIRFNNMMEYIKQYPELQSQRTIEKLVENVKEKRNEIISESKTYTEVKKESNVYLNIARNKLQEVQDELVSFEKMKKEGEQKVNDAQDKGLKNRLLNWNKTEAEKQSTRLDMFKYDRKIDTSKNQLKLIEQRIKKYEDRDFKPTVTTKFNDIE